MKENIIMIHGLWTTGSCWDNFRSFFDSNNYNCITPTLPFHNQEPGGQPAPALAKMGVEDYLLFLKEEIAKLDSPPILMGHSGGGLLAQLIAAEMDIKALILLCSAVPWGIFKLDSEVIKCFWGLVKRGILLSDAPVKLTFEEAQFAIFNNMSESMQKSEYNRMVFESAKVVKEMGFFPAPGLGKKVTEVDESKIHCPVLVLAGCLDRITTLPFQRKLAEKLNAEYREFPDMAHYITGETGWEDVADYIYVWLNEQLG